MPRNTKDDPPFACGFTFCAAFVRIMWPESDIALARSAAAAGVTENALRYRADRLGILEERRKRRKYLYSRLRFKQLWEDHSLSRNDIAEILGMPPDVVGDHAKANGLRPRNGGFKKIIWAEDFTAMWVAGVRTEEIARQHYCDPAAVRMEAVRRDLERRRMAFKGIPMAHYRASIAEAMLARAMARDARTTQLAFEATGRQTLTHWAELRRIAA